MLIQLNEAGGTKRDYVVVPRRVRRNGRDILVPVEEYDVEMFTDSFDTLGGQSQERIGPYTSRIFPNFMLGFGRDRIASDSARNPAEYRRFFDSTCDTRFEKIYLPILEENSTETGLEVIRASAAFKSNLWGIWEDGTSTDLLARKYVGSTTAWTAGGNVLADATTKVGLDLLAHKTHLLALFAQSNDHLIYRSTDGATWTAATTAPTLNLLSNAVTANEDIDAGLLAELSGLAIAVVWDEVAGNIVFFSSRNAGDTWDKQEDIRPHTTKTFGPLTGGFGRDRITALKADDPAEYQRLFDATADTRWDSGIYLPILEEDSTETGLEVIRGSTSLRGDLWAMWEDDTSTDIVARKYTGSSTSWTDGGNIQAAAAAQVGLDIITHKNRVIALLASANDHLVFYSNGATPTLSSWTAAATQITANLLINDVTAHENIDAGLLTSIGGEAVALIWEENGGVITFFSSTNAGGAWADEVLNIPSSTGIKGVAVLPGIDGEDKIYVGVDDGIFEVDTAPATWTARLIFPMPSHKDNCRRMTFHTDGSLWFAQGVDDDSPPPIYRMTVSGDSRVFESLGLNRGDGIPSDRLGPVWWFKSAGGFLFCSQGGGKAGRNATIWCWNGRGWHSMRKHGTENQKIEWIDVSSGDDDTSRLHYSIRTAAGISDTVFLGQPLVNPASGVSIKREASGYIDYPYIDGGMPSDNALWIRASVDADDLSATNSNEFIDCTHGINGAARTTTDLGDFLSGTKTLEYAADTSAINDGIRLVLNHDDGGTDTDTPILRTLEMDFVKPLDTFGKIASGNGPQGVAAFNDRLYVGAREGIYEVLARDFALWEMKLVVPLPPHNDNGRRMTVHQDKLWFGLGVDDDSPAPIWTLDAAGNVDTRMGLDQGDSVPAEMMGPVRWMKSVGDFLFMTVGGGKASRNARVLCHNGRGWHSMRQHGTANQKIEWLDFSSDDDDTPRLHYSIRTAAGISDTVFLGQPLVNPASGVSIKREATGYIDLPYMDGGMPLINAAWLRFGINASSLSASNSGEYIQMKYGLNGASRTTSPATAFEFVSGTLTQDLPSGATAGAGVSARNIGTRVTLNRDASDNTHTPELEDVEINYLKIPPTLEGYIFTVDVKATATKQSTKPEVVITRLKAARDLGTLPVLVYGPSGSKNVKVRDVRWLPEVTEGSASGAAAPDVLAQRAGYLEVRCEEVI
jgi:hypothetical protein